MANNVGNTLAFLCPKQSAIEVDQALRTIAKQVRRGRFDLGDRRVRREPGGDWHFISPWGPAETLQNHLTVRLAEIDPAIVVVNRWIEEFDEVPYARITSMKKGLLHESHFELDIDESIYDDLIIDEIGLDDIKGLVVIDGSHHFDVAKKAKSSAKLRRHRTAT